VGVKAEDQQAVQAAIDRLLDEVDAEELGAEIADFVLRDVPELAGRADEDLRQTAHGAGVQSIVDLWADLRAGARRREITPPREGLAFAVELVRRGVDLGALLRAWRLGHEIVEARWEQAADRLDLDSELRWRALAKAVRFSFQYVDAVSVQLAETYAEERARWVRGAAAARAETVRELLAGTAIPRGQASATLGYDVDARHVAFIVWADTQAPDAGSAGSLEGVAADVADALGDGPRLLLAIGHWVVWGWATAYRDRGERPSERVGLPRGVHVAVGSAADGLAGFVRSHEEAMLARRAAVLVGRRAGTVVRHESVALIGLLSADPVAAARFVEAELGELAENSDAAARLRATLRVYLDENASPARTSRRLSVNKNTVVYRVKQAEEILGHPVASRRSELDAALRLADVLEGLRAFAARDAGEPPPTG